MRGTAAEAKARLKKKLWEKGKGGVSQISAPTDAKVIVLLHEAQAAWDTDRRRASVSFRLAARRGYVPALVLLASKAQVAGDEILAIEALCSLLQHAEAKEQIPGEMLRNHATQLAMLLREDRHQDQARQKRQEVRSLAKGWPVLEAVETAQESRLTLAAVQALCAGGGGGAGSGGCVSDLAAAAAVGQAALGSGDSKAVESTQESRLAFAAVQALCAGGGGGAGSGGCVSDLAATAAVGQAALGSGGSKAEEKRSATEGLIAEITRLDRQIHAAQRTASNTSIPEVGGADATSVINAINEATASAANRPAAAAPAAALSETCRGRWEKRDCGWHFLLKVPEECSWESGVPEGCLQISNEEIKVYSTPASEPFAHEPIPSGSSPAQAVTEWLKTSHELSVFVPVTSTQRTAMHEMD